MAQPMKTVTQFSLAAPFSSEYSLQPMKTVTQFSLAAPFSSEYSLKSCVSYLDLRFVLTLARITVPPATVC